MRAVLQVILFLMAGLGSPVWAQSAASLDLRQETFDDSKVHRIAANWEVYWGQLLMPQDFNAEARTPSELRPYNVAISADKGLHQGQSNEFRHGTWRLRLTLPNHEAPFALFVPEIRGASRIWLNGQEVAKNGKVGTDLDSETIKMRIQTINIPSGVNDVELVVQSSSYGFGKIGPFTPFLVGPRVNIDASRWYAMLRDTFTLSAILIMAFYHFALYIVRGKGIEPVLFGGFCLAMSGITLTRSEGLLIFHLFKDPSTYLIYKYEFLSFAVSVGMMGYYTRRLYPQYLPLWLFRTVATGTTIFATICLLGPLRAIDFSLIYFQLFMLSTSFLYIGCLVRAAWNKADGAKLFVSGFVIIIMGAINDILKTNSVIDTISVSHMTLFCFILIQSIILSKRFSKAFDMLEVAEGEIRGLNADLEKKVQDRTATIRMILDNVKSGFLLIDSDFKVRPGFTKSCEEILEHALVPGDSFGHLFSISDRQRGDLEVALMQVFDDIMPESVTLSMIKSRLPVKNRQVMIQSAVIRDEQQKIQSILITLTDATHVAQMEKEAKLSQTLVKILQAQVNFKSLLGESFMDLERAKGLLKEDGQKAVKMVLHTIKGNFASFGLEEIAHSIHELEDKGAVNANEIDELVQTIHQFLESYKDILKIDPASLNEKSYRLHDAHLLRLSERLKNKGATRELLDTFATWMDEIKQISFDELIGPIGKKARRIAESIGKKVNLTIDGGNIAVDADRLQSVIHSLIHLVRNSIDHGLEFPDERGDKGEEGTIFIRVRRDERAFHIEAGDDGRGINAEIIRKVALNKGLIKPEEAAQLNDQDSLALIFRSGFSTRDEVTSLSGRGVGMSAIESAVLELGGKIAIDTKLGQGTCFRIEIPEVSAPVMEHRKSA
ncbi:MAG TPA: 7TM diverse intracellular signaling domain-containing protein [Oligoflexus sp.]|uniref:7TM diverse intracellular signaling domain-containing protein n=1 Tax=Oligoflexus sp. TaxID=1971216 RepID=UPI002D414C4B|nr:7TM diverse intracellular signaling domain-containing protein [Oligoflexus sp.]HYX38996.1 7TM diverse intracellular signaling domain-containing protein [Oligoflexus sp.]